MLCIIVDSSVFVKFLQFFNLIFHSPCVLACYREPHMCLRQEAVPPLEFSVQEVVLLQKCTVSYSFGAVLGRHVPNLDLFQILQRFVIFRFFVCDQFLFSILVFNFLSD